VGDDFRELTYGLRRRGMDGGLQVP
jgi:hypothetical protein